MKGIDFPPEEEDFTADPVELFFDLAFVFAFSRLVYHLVHHPDWNGFAEYVLLVTLIWVGWSQFTWSANAVPGNQRPVRVLFLIGTVASIPMAVAVTTAFDDGAWAFAIGLGVILSLGIFTMIFGLPAGHAVRASAVQYAIPNLVAVVLLLVGAAVGGGAQVVVWWSAVVVLIVAMLFAGGNSWVVRPGHFAERHGLIIIVALGEVVVALGVPLTASLQDGEGLPAELIATMLAAGAFACLLWWAYFDRVQGALEHRHGEENADGLTGRFARDVYTLAHLPIVAGVVLVAAALEEIALHPSDELPTAFRWMFVGGMVFFFGGVTLGVLRAYRVVAKERIAAALAMSAVVAFAGGSVNGLVLLVIVDLILVAALVVENIRIEGRANAASSDHAVTG